MIDWDDVAAEAECTPGSILALLQGRVDEIDGLVIVARFKSGTWRTDYSDKLLQALGLVEGARLLLQHDLLGAMEEPE